MYVCSTFVINTYITVWILCCQIGSDIAISLFNYDMVYEAKSLGLL